MNIHPAFVHFPIAFLFVYTLIELLPLSKFFPLVSWVTIKNFLLYTGTLFLFPTILTGLIASHLGGESRLADTHEYAAFTTLAIFVAASWLTFQGTFQKVRTVLAFLGLVALFVTGGLGAAMVHGFDVDPWVSFLTSILGFQ